MPGMAVQRGDWFHALFGVTETDLRRELSVSQKPGSDAWNLVCQANRRSFNAGSWRIDTLGGLREAAKASSMPGKLQVGHVVIDDWVELLSRPENNGAVVLMPTLSRRPTASADESMQPEPSFSWAAAVGPAAVARGLGLIPGTSRGLPSCGELCLCGDCAAQG